MIPEALRANSYKKYIIAATVLAIILIGLFLIFSRLLSDFMGMEVFKISYEFLLIIVIGGAVSWLFSQYTFEKEAREQKKTLQREFQEELIKAYNSSKCIRRMLRAEARSSIPDTGGMAIKAEPYSKQMQKLNDVQLKFEFLKKESINTDLFRDAPNLSDLNSLLASIEGYLHDIISEYEQSYDKFSDDNLCPVEKLPLLSEFIYSPAEHEQKSISDNFKNKFKKPADKAMEDMLKILINK